LRLWLSDISKRLWQNAVGKATETNGSYTKILTCVHTYMYIHIYVCIWYVGKACSFLNPNIIR